MKRSLVTESKQITWNMTSKGSQHAWSSPSGPTLVCLPLAGLTWCPQIMPGPSYDNRSVVSNVRSTLHCCVNKTACTDSWHLLSDLLSTYVFWISCSNWPTQETFSCAFYSERWYLFLISFYLPINLGFAYLVAFSYGPTRIEEALKAEAVVTKML